MRTFRDREKRLAALEAKAEAQAAAVGPLTQDDCTILLTQVSLFNVSLGADGRVRRAWRCGTDEYTAQFDVAIGRLNAALAQQPAPLTQAEVVAMLESQAGPPYWAGCMRCGNSSDPRDQNPDDRRCLWCGAASWDSGPPRPTFVCPRCDDEHGPEARVPSEWNRAGACPACGAAPPPTEAEPRARFDAWCTWIGVADADA